MGDIVNYEVVTNTKVYIVTLLLIFMSEQKIPYERIESFVAGVLGVQPQEGRTYTPEQIAEAQQGLDRALGTLNFREREVIKLKYGLRDGFVYTLDEIGRIFRTTKERANQIRAKAIRKLEHPVRREMLEGLLGYHSQK